MNWKFWILTSAILFWNLNLQSEAIQNYNDSINLSKSLKVYQGATDNVSFCSEIYSSLQNDDLWKINQKDFLQTKIGEKSLWISFEISNPFEREFIYFLPFFTGKYLELILCEEENGKWIESKSGESIPSESKIINSNLPDFQLLIPKKKSKKFFLKMISSSSINTQIIIYPVNTFLNLSNLHNSLGIILIIIYILIFLFLIIRYSQNKNKSFLYLLCFGLCLLFFSLSEINYFSVLSYLLNPKISIESSFYFFVLILSHQANTINFIEQEDFPSSLPLLHKILFLLGLIIFLFILLDLAPIHKTYIITFFGIFVFGLNIFTCRHYIKEDYPPADIFFYSLVILLFPGFIYFLYTIQILPSGFPSYFLVLVLPIHFIMISYIEFKKIIESNESSLINIPVDEILNEKIQRPIYKKSHILGINVDKKILELKKLLEVDKVYLDEELHSGDLAAMLSLTPHQLSQLLSQILETHYHKMIQEYRIKEAVERIKLNEEKNLLTIGYEVGFQSKSAFNTAFKKITGKTPMEIKKSAIKNK